MCKVGEEIAEAYYEARRARRIVGAALRLAYFAIWVGGVGLICGLFT